MPKPPAGQGLLVVDLLVGAALRGEIIQDVVSVRLGQGGETGPFGPEDLPNGQAFKRFKPVRLTRGWTAAILAKGGPITPVSPARRRPVPLEQNREHGLVSSDLSSDNSSLPGTTTTAKHRGPMGDDSCRAINCRANGGGFFKRRLALVALHGSPPYSCPSGITPAGSGVSNAFYRLDASIDRGITYGGGP